MFAWEPERRAGLAGGTTRPSEEGTLNSFVKAEHVLDGRYSFRSAAHLEAAFHLSGLNIACLSIC